jgi:2-keto-4-pentenoate hydratase/2-oxohepta-3-ene-1,7-dioic acid hydratase in catechol pathway
VPLADVRLWAPVPEPAEDHLPWSQLTAPTPKRRAAEVPQAPELFVKFTNTSGRARLADREFPRSTDEVDYEAELAVVIGDRCKDVQAADALDHVYALLDHARTSALGTTSSAPRSGSRARAWTHFGPFGPWVVTADELGDPQDLHMALTIGGEVR